MTNNRHTPGPWRPGRPDMFNMTNDNVAGYGKNVYADDPRGGYHHVTGNALPLSVCEAHGVTTDEAMANARLIAAAPAMLKALLAIEWGVRGEWECPECSARSDRGHEIDCSIARAIYDATACPEDDE